MLPVLGRLKVEDMLLT